MGWLTVLQLALRFASALAKWLGDKQLMDAGEAKATSASLSEALGRVERAKQIRAGIDPRNLTSEQLDSVRRKRPTDGGE